MFELILQLKAFVHPHISGCQVSWLTTLHPPAGLEGRTNMASCEIPERNGHSHGNLSVTGYIYIYILYIIYICLCVCVIAMFDYQRVAMYSVTQEYINHYARTATERSCQG